MNLEKNFLKAQGKQLVDAKGKPVILKGVGIGMWLVPEGYMFRFEGQYQSPRTIEWLTSDLLGPEASRLFWTKFRDGFFTEGDVVQLAKQGFNSIRIPFNYKLLSPETEPGVFREEGFAYLDKAIEWCRKHGLWVILDMHCGPGGQTGTNIDDSWGYPWMWESEADRRRTAEIWAVIAKRYKDDDTVAGYDLLNEPIPQEHRQYFHLLEPLYKEITAAVRKVDTNHTIFLEGGHWATDFSMFSEPFDGNSVYSFHKYWNETSTESIQRFLDYRDKHDVPLWLGETGENKLDWYRDNMALMDEHGIGWAFWPWKKIASANCPFTIPTPRNWDEITGYAKGGPKPCIEHSRVAFEDLLVNIRIENCVENGDVPDALFLR